MRTNFYRVVLVALAITILGAAVFAQPPRLISYQGRVLDNTGAPVADGNHTFDFRLYSAASGGTQVWSELSVSIATVDGLFTYALGTSSIFSSTVFTHWPALFLQVTVDGQLQSPRTRLISAPFAETAGDLSGQSPWYAGPAWRTFRSDHVFTIYGTDGTGNIEMGGTDFGEIWLKDGQVGNVLTARLSANINSGGQLVLTNPSGVSTIDLHGGQTGNTSVFLPSNSIYDVEILDEPGVANKVRSTLHQSLTTTGDIVIDSVSITIPAAGYVEVTGGCYVNTHHVTGTNTWIYAGVSKTRFINYTDPGAIVMSVYAPHATGNIAFPGTSTRLYSEVAGTHKYYFVADRDAGGSSASTCSNVYIRAKFFPTAYGSVVLAVSDNSGVEMPIPVGVSPDGTGQNMELNLMVQTLEEINAKLATEMEALRLENERLRQIEEASRPGTAQGQEANNQQ